MKALTLTATVLALAVFLILAAATPFANSREDKAMELGNFSISLAVNDVKASLAFYEKLGFIVAGGNIKENWVIVQNGTTNIGLFQGMLDGNIMTFNPGWTNGQETLPSFQDVRDLQHTLKARGITMMVEADESTNGPASFMMADPDGNTILVDQHVPSPKL